MDNLIIVAGILAAIRAYWVCNLLREEKGLKKGNIASFIDDENKFNYYIFIRPFFKKMRNERLKTRINIISYIIYGTFIIGMIYALK